MPPYINPERAAHAAGHPYASTSAASDLPRTSSASQSRGGGVQGGRIPTGSVSKLKAQIRQTTRLLAKEELTPDVRVASERRLKTLQIELEKTTNSNLEQKMVTRYRGVKFFERQKILRKIKQAKKALASNPDDQDLHQALLESRIDLYYILRYPKTEKYVSLFPEGTYVPFPSTISASTSKDAASVRTAMRNTQKVAMDQGQLPIEAEGGDLGIEGEEDVGSAGTAAVKIVTAFDTTSNADVLVEQETVVTPVVVEEKKVKKSKKSVAAAEEVEPEVPIDAEMVDVPIEVLDKAEKKMGRKEKKEMKRAGKMAGEAAVVIEKAEGWAEGDDFFA